MKTIKKIALLALRFCLRKYYFLRGFFSPDKQTIYISNLLGFKVGFWDSQRSLRKKVLNPETGVIKCNYDIKLLLKKYGVKKFNIHQYALFNGESLIIILPPKVDLFKKYCFSDIQDEINKKTGVGFKNKLVEFKI